MKRFLQANLHFIIHIAIYNYILVSYIIISIFSNYLYNLLHNSLVIFYK